MTLSQRRLVCPLLIDIGSSCTVTLPYIYHTVCSSLYEELHTLMEYRFKQKGQYPQKQQQFSQVYTENLIHTSMKTILRPCGFSQEHPLLQHESWRVAWQTYLNTVSQRGQVSAAGSAPISHLYSTTEKEYNESQTLYPLIGTLAPIPVPVHIPKDSINEETTTTMMMMEFFRVDAFIPIHVQMYHVMRRVMDPVGLWDVVAIGIVVPTHRTDYFVKAVKDMQKSTIGQFHSKHSLPSIILYDSKGLQIRL